MAGRSFSRHWKALVAGCCLASSVVWLSGAATTSSSSALGPSVAGGAAGPVLRVLQLNLCNSGIAACYTGRSVAAAEAVIRNQRPDIVTLNEVCRPDVSELERALSESRHGTRVAAAFHPAGNRLTSAPFWCRSGQQYGIGVLAVIPSADQLYRTYAGVYPIQDLADPEERVWLCIHAAAAFVACTTHTASTSTSVALAQCRYFFGSAVPSLPGRGADPVILGADLNLTAGGRPDPQSCLPAGYHHIDDGSRQDVVTSPGVAERSRTVIDMHATTDHPGLLVALTLPG